MKYLIDTHTFLWFNEINSEISSKAKEIIENIENEIYISMASLWEISIKVNLGKLFINNDFESILEDINDEGIIILPINFPHICINNKLPQFHKDPFDRIIISQALSENFNIISKDAIFDKYLVETELSRIWN
jgi:PIN domain nuclease of toxin-antitoxin system